MAGIKRDVEKDLKFDGKTAEIALISCIFSWKLEGFCGGDRVRITYAHKHKQSVDILTEVLTEVLTDHLTGILTDILTEILSVIACDCL
jgi:hypothetical protein